MLDVTLLTVNLEYLYLFCVKKLDLRSFFLTLSRKFIFEIIMNKKNR